VRKADNLPHSCTDVKKSGSLNPLEPSGSVQAYNGTALLFKPGGTYSNHWGWEGYVGYYVTLVSTGGFRYR
jgi:hypothetical protein